MPTPSERDGLNLHRLCKLRLIVARTGEMDNARWWNTQGQLGPLGASVLKRGFPRTHAFARARSVFAVAAARCQEVFDPPGAVTLWKQPAGVEDGFEAAWEHWLAEEGAWRSFFERLEVLKGHDVLEAMRHFDLLPDEELQTVRGLRTTAEGRAVAVPGMPLSDRFTTLLAAAFALGKPGALVVPYASIEA